MTYDLLLKVMNITKSFPKEFKYTLGEKLKDELITFKNVYIQVPGVFIAPPDKLL